MVNNFVFCLSIVITLSGIDARTGEANDAVTAGDSGSLLLKLIIEALKSQSTDTGNTQNINTDINAQGGDVVQTVANSNNFPGAGSLTSATSNQEATATAASDNVVAKGEAGDSTNNEYNSVQ